MGVYTCLQIENQKISADVKIQQQVEQIKRQKTSSEGGFVQRRAKPKAKGPNPLSMKKSKKVSANKFDE